MLSIEVSKAVGVSSKHPRARRRDTSILECIVIIVVERVVVFDRELCTGKRRGTLREVGLAVIGPLTVVLANKHSNRVHRGHIRHVNARPATAVDRGRVRLRVNVEALGSRNLLEVVGAGTEAPVVRAALGVRAQSGHELRAAGVGVNAVDSTVQSIRVVSVGDGGVGTRLDDADTALRDLPVNLEETSASLRVARGDGHADDGRAAIDGSNANTRAKVVLKGSALVVTRNVGEVRANLSMAAREVQVGSRRDGHGKAIDGDGIDGLRANGRRALDGVVTGLQGGKVHAVPAEGLLSRLRLPAAHGRVLHCGIRIAGDRRCTISVVRRDVVVEAIPRGALELPRADVVGTGGTSDRSLLCSEAEEGHKVLADVVGHVHGQGVDAGRGHVEREDTRLGVIGPHVHVRGVLDAVDGNAVHGLRADGLASLVVRCDGHARVGSDDGNADLALGGHVAGDVRHVGGEVEGGLSGGVLDGVDELDAGGLDHRLALVVQLRVGLRDVHEAGGLVHDEAVARHGVGVVLDGCPVGELGTLDVGTGPTDVVVGVGVNLEEDRVGDGVGEHCIPVVGHAVAVLVGLPKGLKGGVRELAAIDHGGRHGQQVLAGEVVALTYVLGVGVVADVLLDAGVGTLLVNGDGLERVRPGGAVLVEGAGDADVAVHREGGLAVREVNCGGLGLGSENREAVRKVTVVRRGVDGDLAAHVNGDGAVVGPVKGERAVLRLHQGDSRRLRCLRRLCGGREDGRERAECGAHNDKGCHELLRKAGVAELALDALDTAVNSFHQILLSCS